MSLPQLLSAVFLVLTMSVEMPEANPIPPNSVIYCGYSRLKSNVFDALSETHSLRHNFKTNRFPGEQWVVPVNITTLPRTEAMTSDRLSLNETSWLSAHHRYFLSYQIIIYNLWADEANTTSTPNFLSEMVEIRRLLRVTVANLEDLMMKVGFTPISIRALSEDVSPYFDPYWQKDVAKRYRRDLYTLDQMYRHLDKAHGDFAEMQTTFHTQVSCSASS